MICLENFSISSVGGRGIISRLSSGKYLLYTGRALDNFLDRFRSISVILYLPVMPVRKGSPVQSISRIMRGAPFSEIRPERMTLESRNTLTTFFAISLFEKGFSLLL